jgi:transcription antitermination factor NusG
MESHDDDFRWYALYVRERYEKIVTANLIGKGYEVFLPTYQSKRRWSDRTKVVEVPLFSRYVICRFDFRNRLPILTVPGVHFIVGFGQTVTPIDPAELNAVRLAVDSGLPYEPWPFLKAGYRVRVEYGPLTGLEGFVLDVKNAYRLVISLNLLGRSVAVELDRDAVKPISHPKPEHTGMAMR